jgi:hypothetical protein
MFLADRYQCILLALEVVMSAASDVGHQSQRTDIVVDASSDVGDRYSPATSSCAMTAIPQCMALH